MYYSHNGFTLIELLVVVSIISLLSSMIFLSFGEESVHDRLDASARELQATILKARSLARSDGYAYAITFNVTNSGDSSVLKNFSDQTEDKRGKTGGHWYALIGPDKSGITTCRYYPPATSPSNSTGEINGRQNGTAREFEKTVREAQIGSRHYLEKGIRILALSDAEYGHRRCRPAGPSGYWSGRGDGSERDLTATYPRAWYGYYDDTKKKYYPWGAYNPEIDADANYRVTNAGAVGVLCGVTGFNYAGVDGPIPYNAQLDCLINPDEVHGRLYGFSTGARSCYPGHKGSVAGSNALFYSDTVSSPDFDQELTYTGKPRPLIDGGLMDFTLMFLPNGKVVFTAGASNSARMAFYEYSSQSWYTRFRGAITPYNDTFETGGYHITLARDVVEDDEIYKKTNPVTGQLDYTAIDSADEALESIMPYCRVFVNASTAECVIKGMDHPDSIIQASDLMVK